MNLEILQNFKLIFKKINIKLNYKDLINNYIKMKKLLIIGKVFNISI